MTQEEARKAAEVMLAYAEGKEIEFRNIGTPVWVCNGKFDADEMSFNFTDFEYRIKKEPTYRPFKDKDECWNEMQKHQPFGWVKKQIISTITFIWYQIQEQLFTTIRYFTMKFSNRVFSLTEHHSG